MDIISETKNKIKNVLSELGYKDDLILIHFSSRPELGQFQYNGAMQIAKSMRLNPREIAKNIVEKLNKYDCFEKLNIAGPGFINISFNSNYLINYLNEIQNDISINIKKYPKKKIIIDYGGPNVAKALHVGHLRSSNIGEALKRLACLVGNDVIGDVHLGDIGRQSGMIIYGIKEKFPELVYFDDKYTDKYPERLPITNEDIEKIYPEISLRAKNDEEIMKEVRNITAELDRGNKGYNSLWNYIKQVSKENIKRTFDKINVSFELWEGESDSYQYIDKVINLLKSQNCLEESEGAYVVYVQKEDDKFEIPPLIVLKSDGTSLYATRELATAYSRVERFNPDEIWYVVDSRQSMYFTQVFRTLYKSGIVDNKTKLEFIGFGTMNGKDGKPFKTRDGGVMKLETLLDEIKKESNEYLKKENIKESEKEEIANKVSVATLKYADLLPNREKDYVFELKRFSSLEGKTGPYIIYSCIRIKSLLEKSGENDYKIVNIYSKTEKDIITKILQMPIVIDSSYRNKTLSDITEYLYELDSLYNKFYSENRILTESNKDKRKSWLAISQLVFKVNKLLLDTLAIEIPEKM
ncbi:MAG: arginine--tRNA ligase [Clostridia bacterium]|nr:arginine--tRNA ligase [Clostridia bacterium]